jgi:hypothetical protein
MALLLLRGFSTPSLLAQGEQRLPSYFNIDRDMPRRSSRERSARSPPTMPLGAGERRCSGKESHKHSRRSRFLSGGLHGVRNNLSQSDAENVNEVLAKASADTSVTAPAARIRITSRRDASGSALPRRPIAVREVHKV